MLLIVLKSLNYQILKLPFEILIIRLSLRINTFYKYSIPKFNALLNFRTVF